MADESQHEYEQYRFELRRIPVLAFGSATSFYPKKATVHYLHKCRHCDGLGHRSGVTDPKLVWPCVCVAHFKCPQCGHQHGRMVIAWAVPSRLKYCTQCGWEPTLGDNNECQG